MSKPRIIGIIPARYDSTRLPGKPLIKINGKPMIQHVWERSRRSKLIGRLFVATDDRRIYDAVREFGGKAVMTSKKRQSGTDRIGEAAKKLKCKIIVNIQGDEPLIDHRNIDRAIKPLLADKKLNVSTLGYEITNSDEIGNPNVVKVVFNKNYEALYFSRYPLPYNRDGSMKVKYYKHIGLYVYRRDYLLKLIRMKQSELEEAEKLEQLRILQNGEKIKVVLTDIDSHSIDTEEDLQELQIGH
ncbi:MAG: 3-deoxy-manno-octulosonate cytidylyltransferase [Ignavibacteria bacterium]